MSGLPPQRAPLVGRIPDLTTGAGRRALLFLTGLSLLLSANTAARFEAGGLLFQPVLVPVGLLWLIGSSVIMKRIPAFIRTSLVVYLVLFAIVEIVHGFNLAGVARAATLGIILFGVAGSIDDEDDVRAVALGMVIAMGVVSTQAMVGTTAGVRGINPFDGVGNQNAFSLYALPAVLLGAYFTLARGTAHRTRIIMAAGAAASALAILSTTNRSGYLGLALIVVLLVLRGRNATQAFGAIVLSVALFFGFMAWGDTSAFDFRTQTEDGQIAGRETRESLVQGSINVGLQNPILGVGQRNVGTALSRELELDRSQVATHNLLTDLFAGGGFPLLMAFFVAIVALASRPSEWKKWGPPTPDEKHARGLLRAILLLLLVRGMFGGEVLTTPAFMILLGVGVGATIINAPARSQGALEDTAAEPPPTGRPTAWASGGRSPRVADRFEHPRRLVRFDPWSQR